MALPRTEVTTGLLEELERFKGLIGPLGRAEWATPSRCTGWTVADIAAHVIGGMADVAAFRLEGLGTPEVLALDGQPVFEVNSGGRGSRFTGDPLAFVLAATGRADPGPLGLDQSANIYRPAPVG